MRYVRRVAFVWALSFLVASFQPAYGQGEDQLCFDLFLEQDVPLLQCADTDYFFDGVGGGVDFESFGKNSNDPLEAEFEGLDLFDDPEIEKPDSIGESFFASAGVDFSADAQGVTGFTLEHRGSVSMTPRESDFQSAAYQTRSRVTFMPVNTVDPSAPLTLNFEIDFEFTLADPIENATRGAALGGLGIKLLDANKMLANPDAPVDPEFDMSVLAQLDFNIEEPDIENDLDFIGFDDPELADAILEIDVQPAAPDIVDEFDIDIELELELELPELELDDPDDLPELILETDTFGNIFTDGFEAGNTFAWKAESPDTMRFTVTSPDPNVRFIIVGLKDLPMPSPPAPDLKIVRRDEAQGGKVALRFSSVEGQKYRLDSTTDFKNFTALTDIEGTGSDVEFIDASSQSEATRYYRLVVP